MSTATDLPPDERRKLSEDLALAVGWTYKDGIWHCPPCIGRCSLAAMKLGCRTSPPAYDSPEMFMAAMEGDFDMSITNMEPGRWDVFLSSRVFHARGQGKTKAEALARARIAAAATSAATGQEESDG